MDASLLDRQPQEPAATPVATAAEASGEDLTAAPPDQPAVDAGDLAELDVFA